MLIDCDRCEMREIACDDCVVTALLTGSEGPIADDTVVALQVLADAGLAAPLRLRLPPAVAG